MKSFTQLTQSEDRVAIVDSLNLAFRYKHAKATNFAESYMATVDSLRRSYKCDKLVITGDMGSSSYRKAIYPLYKQNRKDKYALQTEQEAEEFEIFFAEMQNILVIYEEDAKYPVLRFPGVEADDLAAYIVLKRKKFNIPFIWLFSSDRDWSLLVDEYVSQFSYVTRKEITYDNWHEHYEFTRDEYISIKCLTGDSGDNVPGVPGIGPKKALDLVRKYENSVNIAASLPITSKYKYVASLNEFGAENIMRNYQLMDLLTFSEEAIGEENCKQIDNILEEYFK